MCTHLVAVHVVAIFQGNLGAFASILACYLLGLLGPNLHVGLDDMVCFCVLREV